MDKAEITKYKDNLLNNLRFHGEYDGAAGIKKKILLVEGPTDKAFVEHIITADSKVYSVADFMKTRAAFSTSPPCEPPQYNSKQVIVELLKHISLIPDYINCPKGADQWPLYGMVDSDSGGNGDCTRIMRLFFTDAHDLETMMLSTDTGLLSRLEQCEISDEDLRIALYLSEQLAAFRKAILKNDILKVSDIGEVDGTVSFDAFTGKDYTIYLDQLLTYLSNKADKPLSREKLRRVNRAIADEMKRVLDKDGRWKKPLESYTVDQSKVWTEVNGHDVLSAIRFVNLGAKEAFHNQDGHHKNRDFELALIEAYDYGCLKETELFSKLQSAGLLRESFN